MNSAESEAPKYFDLAHMKLLARPSLILNFIKDDCWNKYADFLSIKWTAVVQSLRKITFDLQNKGEDKVRVLMEKSLRVLSKAMP